MRVAMILLHVLLLLLHLTQMSRKHLFLHRVIFHFLVDHPSSSTTDQASTTVVDMIITLAGPDML
jgi:hypothetical protein